MALPASAQYTDRRQDIVRVLSEVTDGLSDADLARRLGGSDAGVRPQTVNHLCRRMVAEGAVERVRTRPIRNRLVVAPTKPRRARRKPTVRTAVTAEPDPTESASEQPGPEDAGPATAEVAPASPAAEPVVDPPTPADAPSSPARVAPARDVLQSWSRTVNVAAAVAGWVTRAGGTVHSATLEDGPASDLVVSLEGDRVHVEITGWPPDGARTHPTTIAGDWFSAAESAAATRRDAHPGARIVIALPDTRRYRSLAVHRADALAGTGTEVWFVDQGGSVRSG